MKTTKKIVTVVRLQIQAGKANPAPPVGQVLGQYGVNSGEFCKKFNDASSIYKDDVILPVEVTIYKDRTFDFIIKNPCSTHYIKQALGLLKGSGLAKRNIISSISKNKLYEIALVMKKEEKLASVPLKSLVKTLIGTCNSMGIGIK
uniref:ribosomal protein L11 n=1 Tax=Meteora sporadica TaxID=2913902 RepID=UPI0030025D5E|nr:ribosomal protein L11 [Meteora sporadica]